MPEHVIHTSNIYMVAGVWMALAALSSLLAIRFKIAAALIEIVIGILAGNLIGLHANAWIDFVAGFGSILLTFLAGAEIDPAVLRSQIVPATTLGAVSFAAPFAAAGVYAFFIAHWSLDGAKIAGVAMSTTSVAVVYAVMVESGLATRQFGQLILAACFFTDLGTVVALGLLFANYNWSLVLLISSIIVTMAVVPKVLPAILEQMRNYVSEPGLRILFAVIFVLSAVATYAKSEGVLPAYFLGLACAGMMTTHGDVKRRLQTMAMTLLTPFYFLKAGTYVSLRDAWSGIGLIGAYFVIKVAAKIIAVLPVARMFRYPKRDASYLTLMMATGLTFGTISSLYGLTHHYINQAQYTTLVTVVILTAVVPTIIAQALYHPTEDPEEMELEVP